MGRDNVLLVPYSGVQQGYQTVLVSDVLKLEGGGVWDGCKVAASFLGYLLGTVAPVSGLWRRHLLASKNQKVGGTWKHMVVY